MTRGEAAAVLRGLAVALPADRAGEQRLLERVSNHDQAEALRALLVEAGARRLLDGGEMPAA